jgi:predicted methyltransferase
MGVPDETPGGGWMAMTKWMLVAMVIAGSVTASQSVNAAAPAYVAAAMADPGRPDADKARDADRKAAEIVAMTGLKPGQTAVDVFPGRGYYTRIFAKVVGPEGHVYGMVPGDLSERNFHPSDLVKALAAEPGYSNVSLETSAMKDFNPMPKVDLIFISQFYHDMHNPGFGGPDMASQNKGMLNALKPGGTLFIIDHSAPGTGLSATSTLHRIDEAAVKSELEAAGFKLVSESDILKNPADPHDKNVFDPSIRGKTDQFVLVFRKPK